MNFVQLPVLVAQGLLLIRSSELRAWGLKERERGIEEEGGGKRKRQIEGLETLSVMTIQSSSERCTGGSNLRRRSPSFSSFIDSEPFWS